MRRTRTHHNPEFDAAAEARIESAVAHFEALANSALSQLENPNSRRYEEYFDRFVFWLDDNKHKVSGRAREILEQAEDYNLATVDDETLLQAVSDPALYDFGLAREAKKKASVVWQAAVGPLKIQQTRGRWFDKDFSLDEAVEMLRRLNRSEIEIEFRDEMQSDVRSLIADYGTENLLEGIEKHWRKVWPSPLLGPVRVVTRAGIGLRMQARLSRMALVDKLRELIDEREKSSAPDEVVYRYAGTNDTVAGASARGFYVASLRPDQLRAEGAALGICVGKEEMGYKQAVRDGVIQIFSIRTEAGESKFCIERKVPSEEVYQHPETLQEVRASTSDHIQQVKGTANRLPGFEPGASVLTKPDEVRLVVEFLQEWGFKDEKIMWMNDIGPGVRTMLENGINPFIPPPKRQRPMLSPEEREARRLAAMRRRGAAENPALVPSPQTAAMIREDYAHPWGGRWGT